MIAEIITILTLLGGGIYFVRSAGIKGWPLPVVGFVSGVALFIVIGTLQVIMGLPSTPVLSIGLTLLVPSAWWFRCRSRGQDLSIKLFPAVIMIIVAVVLVLFFRVAMLTGVSMDSFSYLTVSSLLEKGKLDVASPFLLMSRLLAVPLLHAPANLVNELYFPSISPLLAISTLGTLAWISWEGLRVAPGDSSTARLFSAVAIGLLITNNRFIFNAFYINGHMLTAALLLVLIGCGWLIIRQVDLPEKALLALMVLVLPALTVTRPETSLFSVIALLPFLLYRQVYWKKRAMLLVVAGISIIGWHGFLWSKYAAIGYKIPLSVTGMVAFGLALIIFAPLLSCSRFDKILSWGPSLTEAFLWLTLIVFILFNPNPFITSVIATIKNVFLDRGGWGLSLVFLGMIVLGILILTHAADRIFLRFPLTTFIPFAFLLVYIREGLYRVGHGDSLNRMFLHIVPLAILFVLSAALSARRSLPKHLEKYFNFKN